MSKIGDRIGKVLVDEGLITENVLDAAIERQKTRGGRLGEILIDMGALSTRQFYQALAKQLRVSFCDLRTAKPSREALDLLTASQAKAFRAIPLNIRGSTLDIAVENPADITRLEAIRARTGYRVFPHLSPPGDIDNALRRFYEADGLDDADKDEPATGGEGLYRTEKAGEGFIDDSPAVQMIDNLLLEGARAGASDIHIEPCPDKARSRFRIDGVLESAGDAPRSYHEAMVTRVKVLGGMDVAERRLPQDGRFSMVIDKRRYDLRVSTMPTVYGEKVVIRLLEQTLDRLDFKRLGISQGVLKSLNQALESPYGLVVLGGPTGSGKSTTLATALSTLNKPGKNLVTVEDPVEYVIPGVNHMQVNIKAGLLFANAIRHLLRQDPDVIMVGEIRDVETAEMAFQAALTGHLVLTTIHANDALSVLIRLEEMGVNKYMALTSSVALMSQRLVRTLCPWCKYKAEAPEKVLQEVLEAAGLKDDGSHQVLETTRPCAGCPDRAYKGRTAITEIINVDESFRKRYLSSSDPRSDPFLNPAKRHQGLLADGARKVLEGITTWEEIQAVFNKS